MFDIESNVGGWHVVRSYVKKQSAIRQAGYCLDTTARPYERFRVVRADKSREIVFETLSQWKLSRVA